MDKTNTPSLLAQEVNKLASQCVKCALCLPHCPTYELTQDENESPRGRIALFQALSQETLPLTPKVKKHLDQCLGCRACERVCPAHVEYGLLLTSGRAQLKELSLQIPLPTLPLSSRFLAWIAQHPHAQHLIHRLLWMVEISGLRSLSRKLSLTRLLGLQALDEILPTLPKPITLKPIYEAIGHKRGTVMLFTGCITSWCEQETLLASIFSVVQLGYDVWVPNTQTCCGAIALHAGEREEAKILALKNEHAFKSDNPHFDYILTTATGCSAVLQEYENATFAHKVIDIISFIQQCEWPATLTLKSLPLSVVLHTPCTRRNVLKSSTHPEQLLARIPALQWHSFASLHCCGAAGTYMLDHPTLAKQLALQLLSELKYTNGEKVNYIATSNIGCALHLQRELKNQWPTIKVIHPVVLFARSLGFDFKF